jgi:arginine:ornithine antiporter/lysine permease
MRFRKINILEQPFHLGNAMEKKLGLSALTALVLSSMLGGVFSLPQNMAAVASPSAAHRLGHHRRRDPVPRLRHAAVDPHSPDLDGGIFTYAREGFGELIGFCSAWGYWLCAVIANVSYLVIVFSALSFFTDTPELRLFGDGNTWQSIVALRFCCGLSTFWSCAACRRRRALTWWRPSPNWCRWARLSRSPPAFQLDTFRLDFSGWRWAYRSGSR